MMHHQANGLMGTDAAVVATQTSKSLLGDTKSVIAALPINEYTTAPIRHETPGQSQARSKP